MQKTSFRAYGLIVPVVGLFGGGFTSGNVDLSSADRSTDEAHYAGEAPRPHQEARAAVPSVARSQQKLSAQNRGSKDRGLQFYDTDR